MEIAKQADKFFIVPGMLSAYVEEESALKNCNDLENRTDMIVDSEEEEEDSAAEE